VTSYRREARIVSPLQRINPSARVKDRCVGMSVKKIEPTGIEQPVNRVRSRVNRSASTPHTSTSILVAKCFLAWKQVRWHHLGTARQRPATSSFEYSRIISGVLLRFTYAIEVSRQGSLDVAAGLISRHRQFIRVQDEPNPLMLYDHRGYLIIA